ncbi:hypothetical protein ACFE04_014758 [Oxalis oulophora]
MQLVSCLSFFLLLVTGGGVIFYYDNEKKKYIQDTLSLASHSNFQCAHVQIYKSIGLMLQLVCLLLQRNVVDERVGLYLWKTYTEVYDEILLVCGAHSLVCVPPYIPLLTKEEKDKATLIRIKPYSWDEILDFVVAKTADVYPKDPEFPLAGVDDMTKLAYLHEPGTYTCNILIVVNPFKRLPNLYDSDMMNKYKGAAFGELSPHPFAIVDTAYRSHIYLCYYHFVLCDLNVP